jgi:hypothetical protein
MCGAAIEVPDITLKRDDQPFLGATRDEEAAIMFSPGARMSGFSRPLLSWLGPLDEKYATVGECSTP